MATAYLKKVREGDTADEPEQQEGVPEVGKAPRAVQDWDDRALQRLERL